MAILPNGFAPIARNAVFCENTALFDVVLFIVSSLYGDNQELRETVKSTSIGKLIDTYIENGNKVKTCKLRTEFLMGFFEIRITNSTKTLNCNSSIEYIFDKVLFPNVFSGKMDYKCKCGEENNKVLPFFQLSALKADKIETICTECKKVCYVYTDQIQFSNIVYARVENEVEVGWADMSKAVMINNKVYILCGIVECIRPQNFNNFEHYKAHLLRCTQWFTYDHTQNRLLPAITNKKVKMVPRLYVFAVQKLVFDSESLCAFGDRPELVHFKNFYSVQMNNSTVFVNNSCCPDSLFQALSCIYLDSRKFRDLCLLRKIKAENQLIDIFDAVFNHDVKAAHMIRNEMLLKFFQSSKSNGLITIDCDSNIYNVIQAFIEPVFPSVTIIVSQAGY